MCCPATGNGWTCRYRVVPTVRQTTHAGAPLLPSRLPSSPPAFPPAPACLATASLPLNVHDCNLPAVRHHRVWPALRVLRLGGVGAGAGGHRGAGRHAAALLAAVRVRGRAVHRHRQPVAAAQLGEGVAPGALPGLNRAGGGGGWSGVSDCGVACCFGAVWSRRGTSTRSLSRGFWIWCMRAS